MSERGQALVHPPKAPMAFRVGVVGHRPDRLPKDAEGLAVLRARIAEVLEAVAAAVGRFATSPLATSYDTSHPPALTAYSPLAEGSDRIFAEEALKLGWGLTCVMPFESEEFEKDFSGPESLEPDSVARFRRILAEAANGPGLTRFEVNGRRDWAHEAYHAAGSVVLNQSDLLVVVWDGGAAAGVGGTVDTLREAVRFNVPTIWLDTRAPFGWKLMRSEEDIEGLGGDLPWEPPNVPPADPGLLAREIASVITAELAPPESLGGVHVASGEDAHLAAYLAETHPKWNFAVIWKLFRDFMDRGVIKSPPLRVADFEQQIRSAWPVDGDPLPPEAPKPASSWVNGALRAHYAWSDKLADLYADKHRSGFVTSSLLAATSVLTALLPMAAHFDRNESIATAVFEAFMLTVMLGLPQRARIGRWHQKWLEYRVLAELIRELRILAPLGGARPPPRTAAHLAGYGDPTLSWMNWQARAIGRSIGLPDTRVTGDYIRGLSDEALDFLGEPHPPTGQIGFHHMNAERMERIHHRLHRMSLILFSVTLAGVVGNWVLQLTWPAEHIRVRLSEWLVLTSAFLPALGAALAQINNQGEFARLQRRARAMAAGLTELRSEIAEAGSEAVAPPLAKLAEITAEVAAIMVEETTEWRIVVLDLPHAPG